MSVRNENELEVSKHCDCRFTAGRYGVVDREDVSKEAEMSQRWYLIHTKPNSEYLAAASLEGEGFEYFFPCVNTPRPRPGHTDVPLFPGYLFMRYDSEEQDWPSVHRLPGIWGWVYFDGVAPLVPNEVIADLAKRVAMINQGGGLWKRFRPGELVRVVSGPTDCLAEVIEEPDSPESRVKVLMEFLGRKVSAKVPWFDLRPTREGVELATIRRGRRRTRGRRRWVRGFGPRALASA